LNVNLQKSLREDQIYRIDHFAGKDAVQDLAVFRFSNAIIEPLWNRSLVDFVQITVAETIGVEGRAAYYESSGALRDMVPNHMAELLSLVAMEPPFRSAPSTCATSRWNFSHPHAHCGRRRLPLTPCAVSMAMATSAASKYLHIAKSPTYSQNRIRRRTWPCGWTSTIGGGPACLSIYVPASAWRGH